MFIDLPSPSHHSPSTTAFSMQLAQSAATRSSEDRVTLYPNLEVLCGKPAEETREERGEGDRRHDQPWTAYEVYEPCEVESATCSRLRALCFSTHRGR